MNIISGSSHKRFISIFSDNEIGISYENKRYHVDPYTTITDNLVNVQNRNRTFFVFLNTETELKPQKSLRSQTPICTWHAILKRTGKPHRYFNNNNNKGKLPFITARLKC